MKPAEAEISLCPKVRACIPIAGAGAFATGRIGCVLGYIPMPNMPMPAGTILGCARKMLVAPTGGGGSGMLCCGAAMVWTGNFVLADS